MDPQTQMFSGVYASLENNPPSGSSHNTRIVDVMKIYQAEQKYAFEFLAAWKKNGYEPKWETHLINQCIHAPPPPPQYLLSPLTCTEDSLSDQSVDHEKPEGSGE